MIGQTEFNGKVRWQTNLVERFGPDTLYWDHGTSPVLSEKYVIMVRMHNGESWLAAFDKASGQMRWKVARNYQTPTEGDRARPCGAMPYRKPGPVFIPRR